MHDWSINRGEGCFGSFKQEFVFGRETARVTCENMMEYSKMLWAGSLCARAGKTKYSGLVIVHDDGSKTAAVSSSRRTSSVQNPYPTVL